MRCPVCGKTATVEQEMFCAWSTCPLPLPLPPKLQEAINTTNAAIKAAFTRK